MKKAIIKWVKGSSEGGKQTIPYINEKYYPMLKLEEQTGMFNWSLVVVNLKKLDVSTTISQIYFLMEEAPNNILIKGLEFSLFEGNKLVATGIVQ